ncbi:MAG TPA: cell division ATP-binding protein FtsE [Polyangiaceae bacterium]|jgi:cell division transport system ATP-binding protein|nr:cell division ATP-binding protein FtsE [Polyangiaceae bacterium]
MGLGSRLTSFRPFLRTGKRFDASAGDKPLLVFEHIHKSFGPSRSVLRDLNLTIERGELVFFTGPSGAGKSTLLKLIYGAESADSGRILFMGRDISRLKPESVPYLRRNIGIVFQDFRLVGNWSVADNVAVPLQILGLPRRTIDTRVAEVLEQVGLGGRGFDPAHVLSGGEKQRAAIARAIVSEPALVLADEPTGNLDPQLALDVLELFEDIHQTGVSVIFATHDRTLLEVRPRRVVVLDEGRTTDVPEGLRTVA